MVLFFRSEVQLFDVGSDSIQWGRIPHKRGIFFDTGFIVSGCGAAMVSGAADDDDGAVMVSGAAVVSVVKDALSRSSFEPVDNNSRSGSDAVDSRWKKSASIENCLSWTNGLMCKSLQAFSGYFSTDQC